MKYINVQCSVKLCEFVIFIISFKPVMLSHTWNDNINLQQTIKSTTKLPIFDEITSAIDANVGETVLLPCTVRNLGDKVVSWIRKKDLHILTSSTHTFSADNRFEAVYSSKTDFWGLRIRGVKVSDGGQYECQVNTDPKMSLSLHLNVSDSTNTDPEGSDYKYASVALIKGPTEVYVREGSLVTFTCEIIPIATYGGQEVFLSAKSRIKWHHDGSEISFQFNRGISMEVDYRNKNIKSSTIKISRVLRYDEGVYTCNYPLAKTGSVRLFVLSGEHTEAMQRDAAYTSSVDKMETTINLFSYFLFVTFICILNNSRLK